MSNKTKHVERSHKTFRNNNVIFGEFEKRAMSIATFKEVGKSKEMPIIERIKNSFKRPQSK